MDEQNFSFEGAPQSEAPQAPAWTPPPPRAFPVDKRDRAYALGFLICAMGGANGFLMGGLNIAAAVFMTAFMGLACCYILGREDSQKSAYGIAVTVLSAVIGLSFLRNDDNALKFLLLMLVLCAYPLGLSILAGKNRRDPGHVASILDAGNALFIRGFGDGPVAVSSLFKNRTGEKSSGNTWSVVKGLLIAVPVLLVLLTLLRLADAAFDQLVAKLPDLELGEILTTLIFGSILSFPLLGMCLSLAHEPKKELVPTTRKGAAPATVNTVLICVCLVYVLYLMSQLAYFVSGFAGLLPSGYTTAQYARRGFFEMAIVCALNLGIIGLSVWLVHKENGIPGLTKGLCLFIAAVTLFLVGSALSKMFLYIGVYGLTYLRVLTSLFMIWLALAVVLTGISLFRKVSYMKTLVITALVIAAVVSWAGLDTFVAKYNVEAYLDGRLEAVDVAYLDRLDNAAVPYLAELLDCGDPEVEAQARDVLNGAARWGTGDIRWDYDEECWVRDSGDIREWNITRSKASDILWGLIEDGKVNDPQHLEPHYTGFYD